MAIIQTKYNVDDILYTVFGNNIIFSNKIASFKVKEVGYNRNGIVYLCDGFSGVYKEDGVPEHEIIGKTKQDVRIFIKNKVEKEINELRLKEHELLESLEKIKVKK